MMNRISNLCYRKSLFNAAINVFSRQTKNFSILINFDRYFIRGGIDRLKDSFYDFSEESKIEFI